MEAKAIWGPVREPSSDYFLPGRPAPNSSTLELNEPSKVTSNVFSKRNCLSAKADSG